MSTMNEHYSAVLADLRERRSKLLIEIQRIDAAIGGLLTFVGHSTEQHPAVSPQPSPEGPAPSPSSRYANISIRWGVLWYLAEFADGFAKTSEIAAALQAGGYKSEAARFPNLVSAVLSSMKAKEEVETNSDDGAPGYRVTAKGQQTWAAIRQGAKFRVATSPSGPTLLSVQ